MKKTILFFFSFAIIMAMMFVGCNTDCCEQNTDSPTKSTTTTSTTIPTLKQFSITYENLLGADNSANPTSFTVKDKISLHDITIDEFYFNGWHDANTDGNIVTGWNAGDRTNDVTLWARWINNGIEDESNDIVINGDRLLKTSMVTVLDTTTDIVCDQSQGAFVSGRGSVTIPPYAIGKYEVTQGLFNAVMGTNPSNYTALIRRLDTQDGLTETDTLLRPVEQVTWYAAIAFCNKLSLLLGKTPCYSVNGVDWANLAYGDIPTSKDDTWNGASCDFNANGYRLPTEAEWECAARGGQYSTTTPWTYPYAGSETVGDVAWYGDNGNSHPWEVGLKQPNTLGLFDFSGNVYEWCWDWYKVDITKEDYTGPSTGSYRVYRGGSWYYDEEDCVLSYRSCNDPDCRYNDIGFRLVCSITE